jgi:gamma-glutamylcyclotransferase (GGCT)/AIG2-like uncharacterized protein YtfP
VSHDQPGPATAPAVDRRASTAADADADADADAWTTVFVYGTLTDAERVADVLDTYRFVGPAVCLGLRRVEGRYPTLVPGGRVAGRVLETPELDRLDAYEGVDTGLYVRLRLPIDRGDGPDGGVDADTIDGTDTADTANANADAADADANADAADADADTALVYVGHPRRLGVDAAGVSAQPWPDGDAFAERVANYAASAAVRIVPTPRPADP